MAKPFSRKFTHSAWGNFLNFLLLLLVALVMVIPMVFTISNAFKPMDEQFLFPPSLFVKNPTLMNFLSVSSLMRESWVPFTRYVFNSVFVTLVGTVGHVLISSLAAYRIAKFQFPLKNVFFNIVVFSLMFSGAVTSIPNYLIMSEIGLIDTLGSIIIPAFAAPLGLFLMKQFMEQMVPDVLIEAAQIDGASGMRIFLRIAMPIVKPAWFTLVIFSFRDLWNSTGGTFIFTEELKTLPYALSNIMAGGISRTGASAAVALIMVIPPVVVFILSQSQVIETMSTSGIKD